MLIGPVLTRELVIAPRRDGFYVYRAVYVAALFVLMCTARLVLWGMQVDRSVGDMARFGAILFQILAPLQLALVIFFSAMRSAGAVAQEKDRRTLVLLLMSRLNNSELVLGKLSASLLSVLVMLAAALPVFMLAVAFGGVSFAQVARVYAVTLATALAAGSLGSTLALWREKTFQTLAMTALALIFWLGVWEPVGAGMLGTTWAGISCGSWATAMSPLRAVLDAARPSPSAGPLLGTAPAPVTVFVAVSLAAAVVLNLVAIVMVRVWNPSREVRRTARPEEHIPESIWGAEHDLAAADHASAESETVAAARAGHVDAQHRAGSARGGRTREVWDNPILWREVCTWAYGRKVIAIRVAYAAFWAMAAAGLYWTVSGAPASSGDEPLIPATAKLLVPLFLVSLVIVNALAVTSITGERDGQSLDLLLATDLAPREFIFGKLGGVFWVTKEMVVGPMLLCGWLWWAGGLSAENLAYVLVGLAVMNVFVAMLGIHCGMIYASSRTAIGVSLGTVFFLFLGVATCILMMILLSGSFSVQLAPFLAFILGGGIGLYVSLGARNPSAAIGAASLLVPFATFYAITSFLLPDNHTLAVFLVMVATYGFTTAAMMVPAVYEFDMAMGRTTGADER